MEIKGKLFIKEYKSESKSDGKVTYLSCNDHNYRLYRKGIYPINDSFFYLYDQSNVIIDGIFQGAFILVNDITINEPCPQDCKKVSNG